MQFTEWIKNKGYTQLWVAERLNLPAMRVHRICNGFKPTLEEVLLIEDFTHRKVKMEDFIQQAKDAYNESRK